MNKKKEDSWPDFYPPNLILPPENASDADGEFYRLVISTPPTERCFWATHQEQPARHESCKTPEKLEAVYGTSFWKNKESLLDALIFLPEALQQRIIASGKVNASMGKMRKTLEEGHYTIWLRKNCNIHLSFSEVK